MEWIICSWSIRGWHCAFELCKLGTCDCCVFRSIWQSDNDPRQWRCMICPHWMVHISNRRSSSRQMLHTGSVSGSIAVGSRSKLRLPSFLRFQHQKSHPNWLPAARPSPHRIRVVDKERPPIHWSRVGDKPSNRVIEWLIWVDMVRVFHHIWSISPSGGHPSTTRCRFIDRDVDMPKCFFTQFVLLGVSLVLGHCPTATALFFHVIEIKCCALISPFAEITSAWSFDCNAWMIRFK